MKRIFIANRAEIALRIIKTANRLGIETVVVYSEADRGLPYTKEATIAVPLKGFEPGETYLNSSVLLDIAKKQSCDALHPGYGFLSENAQFAEDVGAAGLTFIGPSPASMRALGGKIEAKEIAQKLKVPTLESLSFPASDKLIDAFIKKFNFPLLIKASGGGGGRGMRVVRSKEELTEQLTRASNEAQQFFKDPRVFVEPYLETPRHIEVQAFGDRSGYAVALGERDCSMQRRHQKVIEESPAPAITQATREELYESAEKILAKLSYEGAATVEFLYDRGKIFFLEVNTRLQVEHPVTEMVTGLDLVELQIRIASGESLKSILPKRPISQGHAIELRICSEDPINNFQPSTGRILEWKLDPSARVDAGFEEGSKVSHYYDSLIAKAIIHGSNRDDAILKALSFISHSSILGVTTNFPYLRTLLNSQEFKGATHSVHVAEKLIPQIEIISNEEAASIFQTLEKSKSFRPININGQILTPSTNVRIIEQENNKFIVELPNERIISGSTIHRSPSSAALFIFGLSFEIDPRVITKASLHSSSGEQEVRAPLPGKIVSVLVNTNAEVNQGDILFLLESMKMEHPIRASRAGIVQEIRATRGKIVEAREVLAIFA